MVADIKITCFLCPVICGAFREKTAEDAAYTLARLKDTHDDVHSKYDSEYYLINKRA